MGSISHACFWWWFQYVLQVWWNLVNFEKMLKFHDISRAGTVGIFLFSNGLISHAFLMMIPKNLESLMKVRWMFEKMLKFHDEKGSEWAQISHACFWNSIFLMNSNISWLLWMGSHFTCMFLMMIPKNLKFDEIWWTLKKMVKFHDISSRHCKPFSMKKWTSLIFTCMFLMMILINSASLMKFGELWKNVEISWYFEGPAV